MTSNIYRANQVDIKKFNFGDQQVNKYGGKSSRVKYDGSDFFLQTPRMRLPYGLGQYEDKDPNTGEVKRVKYSINMSFAGYELDEDGNPGNQKVRDLYELMGKMKELLVQQAVENSQSWLGLDEANEGVANALTRDILIWSKDKLTKKTNKKYPPTMKAKIGFWDGRFTVNAFNEKKEPVQDLTTNLPKGTEVVCILKLQPVYFAGGKAGFSWQVYQMKIYKPAGMPSYAFVDDPDDDEPVKRVNTEESEEDNSGQSKDALVEDSDDSEDEESEDELDVDDDGKINKKEFDKFGPMIETMYTEAITNICGVLILKIIDCKDLKSSDLNGLADPYCSIRIGDDSNNKLQNKRKKTKIINNTLNPKFNQLFEFPITVKEINNNWSLIIKVKDYDKWNKNDDLGFFSISLKEILKKRKIEGYFKLQNQKEAQIYAKIGFKTNISTSK